WFFFQAEDGIRVFHVTGVQTCALPISGAGLGYVAPAWLGVVLAAAGVVIAPVSFALERRRAPELVWPGPVSRAARAGAGRARRRSEERRAGSERWAAWAGGAPSGRAGL